MARIIYACDGVPEIPAGFPIIVDEQTSVIEPVADYLLRLATVPGRSRRPKTIRTYAEHLHDWFDSLEQSGVDWRDVTEQHIAAYRNRMMSSASPHTGRPYAHSTINDRIRTICRFCIYAVDAGWLEKLPFHFVDVQLRSRRPRSFLTHLNSRPGVTSANVLTIPEFERIPRPLTSTNLRKLFSCLVAPYSLIGKWAVTTGMRRSELCALNVYQIPELRYLDQNELITIRLKVTKGDRPRAVYPPTSLLTQTHHHIVDVRHETVKRARKRHADYVEPDELFLGVRGGSIPPHQLSVVFQNAFRDVGIDGSLHWLRHTYAIAMLKILQRQAQHNPHLNPLKTLQILLGHASIETTSMYLRSVEIHEHDLSSCIDYLHGELVPDGS